MPPAHKHPRASFYLTHTVDVEDFDFVAYNSASMEEDYALITGVGLDSWTLIIAFIVASNWIGARPVNSGRACSLAGPSRRAGCCHSRAALVRVPVCCCTW